MNIKTGPAIHRIIQFYHENEMHLDIPPAVSMGALKILMKNNVFEFGDMYWLQKMGTVM